MLEQRERLFQMLKHKLKIGLAFLCLPLLLAATVVSCGGGDDEVADVSTDVDWGYSGAGAPENWADLSPDNAVCETGMMQSPIDIAGYVDGDAPPLSFSFSRGVDEIVNDGKSLKMNYTGRNRLGLAERTYQLANVHYHSPSEHTIDGEQFPVEIHLVHEQTFGDVAVLAFMYRIGDPDPSLEAALAAAPAIGGTVSGANDAFPDLNAEVFTPDDFGYYWYKGSFTTPPCTEPVDWFVMNQIGTVSQDQVDRLVALIGGPNNRPVQPLNDREISYSGSRPQALRECPGCCCGLEVRHSHDSTR